MESWRKTWRKGIAPLLSGQALLALKKALEKDDVRLLQGAVTNPPPMQAVIDWECSAACPIGYAGWEGEGLESVGDVEEYFARICFECDEATGEPASCRWFLNWWDDTPREEVRAALLEEVNKRLKELDP